MNRQAWLLTAIALTLTLARWTPETSAQRPKSKARDAELKILPADAPGSKTSSQFLQKPGDDRYDPNANDWREVPPWKQTSFFGIRAKGQLFIYVVDCSGSMIDEDRLIRAKRELRRSVLALQHPQRFKVVFYNDQVVPMPGDLPRSADLTSKSQMVQWLRLIEPDGETDPRGAMSLALSLRPDAVFLLSDGEFPEGTVEAIARKNGRKIPIHCIDLSNDSGGEQLQRIARDSGGQYRWRPQVDGP
ncbi:vWA domain-containing protein [Singulisphaera acidiphila]|uniref:Mg-chelatase subunit ChlD n=1 Tax=Singulisphaera acidiphila (strain ATCC BAA-1392 / DSM 18658 / VKM B-2454 / MOB10) TaxID=886293 RepID=L0DLS5_SINAD|nr:vWA domain-containing protein [Singulisphaera acidiphila]AGA30334.1 Mg-chelatase subunit ChlD [Singulisphaera acidiphila DSM 18658]